MKNSALLSMLLLILGMALPACDRDSIRFQASSGDENTAEADFVSVDGDETMDGESETDDFLPDDDIGDGDDVPEDGDVDEDNPSDGDKDSDVDGDASRCQNALALRCGDSYSHSMSVQGLPNEWFGYSCTNRGEGGHEAIYCQVQYIGNS